VSVQTQSSFSKCDIKEGLRSLGLGTGAIVIYHGSLKSFGHVTGGARTVVDAILEAVGCSGTVCAPAFTFRAVNAVAGGVFNPECTPSEMGQLTEELRTREGTLRSIHARHSVCASGPMATRIVGTHCPSPCGQGSPFRAIADLDGLVLLLGVDHNRNTMFHVAEELAPSTMMRLVRVPNVWSEDSSGTRHPMECEAHDLQEPYDFQQIDPLLDKRGIQEKQRVGNAVCRLAKAADLVEVALELLRDDPRALTRRGPALSADSAGAAAARRRC